jgi:hypothetical protein
MDHRIEQISTEQYYKLRAQAIYWLNLAQKHHCRGEHYQELCDYKVAAQCFYDIGHREQLRQIFQKCPNVKGLLPSEITEFGQ